MEPESVARAYYDALDAHEYDRLADLLAVEFVQERPDTTLDGRDRFVRFMREERPDSETEHDLEAVFADADGRVAVEGRLLAADGNVLTTFVDVFAFEDGRVTALRTYTH